MPKNYTPDSTWQSLRLDEVCQPVGGIDPERHGIAAFEYVDVSAVNNSSWRISSSAKHTPQTAPSRARKQVRKNDVIFATIRPSLRRIAIVPDELDGQIVSTAFCILRADHTRILPEFIYYSVLTDDFIRRIRALERGASYPAVSDSDVLNQEVLVPPIQEQQRICNHLQLLQKSIDLENRRGSLLLTLKSGSMTKLFAEGTEGSRLVSSEIGQLPDTWTIVRMDEAIEIKQGQVDPREEPYRSMLHVGPENIEGATGRLLPCKTAQELNLISGKYEFKQGDILYSKIRPYLRKVSLAKSIGICSADMYPLTPRPGFNLHFVYHWMLSDVFTRQAVAHQARTGIPKLNREQLHSILIPKPPPDEQETIAGLLDKVDLARNIALARTSALAQLFDHSLHDILSGALPLKGFLEVSNAS